jgi:poly-gamma-glutamate capsule biosynthesis protein CapA/YwtB (metallophosphatase superfamily)
LNYKKLILSCSILALLGFTFGISYNVSHKANETKSKEHKKVEVTVSEKKDTIERNEDKPVPVISPVKETKKSEVVISSVGDCTLGTDDNFNKATSLPVIYQKSQDPDYLFKNVSSIFKNDDFTVANLETTFTDAAVKRPKTFNFKGDPKLANSLILGNIEAVNISNNHIYDYNQKGFNDTINTLKEKQVKFFGEGYKLITTIKGVKFGLLGYQGWSSDEKILKKLKSDIESLNKENCIVIINFHWGQERKYTPNSIQKKLAHSAIDNGADLIIGHHPHVIQGIEKYKDRYICYSLGNFCFGGNSNPSDKDSFIFQSKFVVEDNKLTSIGIKVVPCSISSVTYKNDYSPTPLKGTEKSRLLTKLNKLSFNLDKRVDENYYFIKTSK